MKKPAPKKSAPASAPARMAGGDPFDHLAEMLRTLFASKLGAGADDESEDEGEYGPNGGSREGDQGEVETEGSKADTSEDVAEMARKGMGPFGPMPMKGMRHISISIMLPLKKPGASD